MSLRVDAPAPDSCSVAATNRHRASQTPELRAPIATWRVSANPVC
jgi:hypothetical protein